MITVGSLQRLGRSGILASLVTIVCCLTPGLTRAQQVGRITGTVLDDETSRPVEGASAVLEDRSGTRQAQITGPDGTFAFEGLSVDSYTLTVTYIGYKTFKGAVAVPVRLPANITIMLTRDPIPVDPLEVTVEGRAPLLQDVGFYDRMDDGWGQFFEPEWIEANKSGYVRLEQFAQRLAGHRPPSACSLVPAYLDRRRINYPTESKYVMHELSAWEIGAAEVYPPTTPLPLFALNDTTQVCGAIILWSNWTAQTRNTIPKINVKLCEPGGRAGHAALEGIVEDKFTEVRLPTSRVRASYPVADTAGLREIEVRADSMGRYRVCDVPVGADVTLVASYGPHVGASVVAEAVSGVRTKLTVTVTAPGSITGRVLNEATGYAFRAPVSVIIVGTDHRTMSNSSGRFSFEDLRPGTYEIRGVCKGFNSLPANVEVVEGGQARTTLVLRPVDRVYRRGCGN